MFNDLMIAILSDLPFKLAWKRIRHVRNGHEFSGSEKIQQCLYENHPENTDEFIYSSTIRKCKCGLIFHDSGFVFRKWI